MIRELITRFNRSLAERMVCSRRAHKAPMRVWFDPDTNTERARDMARSACLYGETVDISRSGLGFLVPSIRVMEKYLVGQERKLNIEIDLPTGTVHMRSIGRRYEMVGVHSSTERFMVGAEIAEMSDMDKENYETFVRLGSRRLNGARAKLELGID
ncbi:MAG: PilZ domain-containing protein [Pyrinomonadaceae bacterium]